jgi:hypothetical protein
MEKISSQIIPLAVNSSEPLSNPKEAGSNLVESHKRYKAAQEEYSRMLLSKITFL